MISLVARLPDPDAPANASASPKRGACSLAARSARAASRDCFTTIRRRRLSAASNSSLSV